MSDSVDLEVIHCHPNLETRQGLLSKHFLSVHLAPLSGSESYGGSLTSNRQQPPASIRRPTRFPTRTLCHFCLLQLTSDIATGFNQHKPPHRTVCVAVDLTAAFYTVNHNVLLSKIERSTLPEPTCRWLSNYLRSRQSVTSCRGIKSKARIVHTGVPQGSNMSPTLFSFYRADIPQPTEPVKRVYYADEITAWASGVNIPELEHKINDYLTEMSCFLRDNSLLISAPKSTVTLFTPDPKQANTHPTIKISDAELPLVRNPKLLGVNLDTLFSFNTHCIQVANKVSKRNNVLKAMAGTNWGQQK